MNPCGLEWRTVSINNKALELQAVKCADSAGNSILISGVITFRIVDPATAVLNMDNPEYYVHTQGQARGGARARSPLATHGSASSH